METSRAERLSEAVATLNDLIALTRGFELHETAQFLAMAKLNLLMDLNGVTDEEFRALCAVLEGETGRKGGHSARKSVAAAFRQRVKAADAESPPPKSWRAPDRLSALQANRIKQ